jgi:putative transposase
MGTYGSIIPGANRLAKIADISKTAKQRLKWFDYYHRHDRNVARTCRYFGISRQTFYRWAPRYNPHDLRSLEDRSHRPQRVRQRTWSPELVAAVLELREQYPRWGKDKLVVLLQRDGHQASASTVGRIISHLKQRRLLREPLRMVPARRRRPERPYGVRKPKEYAAKAPGDIVQLDSLDLRPLPGVVLKQLTARDVVSRWDVLAVHHQATARTTAGFLDVLAARMPFAIKAIQVDGGSEFMAQFEQACQERGIQLFVLPPRSPKLNGCVERANRTHAEEFYEVVDSDFTVADLAPKLLEWERIYNTVRPHQALGYLTPRQFLECYQQNHRKEVMCH